MLVLLYPFDESSSLTALGSASVARGVGQANGDGGKGDEADACVAIEVVTGHGGTHPPGDLAEEEEAGREEGGKSKQG